MAVKLEEPAGSAPTPRYLGRALAAIANTRALWLFSSNFVGFLLLYAIVVYLPLLVVRQLGLTTFHAGFAISAAGGLAALTASQTGRAARHVSEGIRVLWGLICCGLSHVLVAIGGGYLWILACMVVWGLGFGVLMATLNAAAAGLVTSELRAGVLSVFTLLTYLGQSVSPPFFSLFTRDATVSGPFLAGAAISLFPLPLTVAVLIRGPRPSNTP